MRRMMLLMLTATMLLASTEAKAEKPGLGKTTKVVKLYKNVRNFEKIVVFGAFDVKYRQSDKTGVSVKGPKELIDCVSVSSDGKTLTLTSNRVNGKSLWNEIWNRTDNTIVIYVTSPDLIGVSMRGSGDFEAAALDTDVLQVDQVGSGDMDFKNVVCDEFHVNLMGSGDVEAEQVACVSSSLSVKGSGDIEVCFARCKELTANVLGSGDITVKGKPGKVSKMVLGSGDITIE